MSRKYRHRGYQDSDSEPERQAPPRPPAAESLTPEERIQRRSLRRATAREAQEVVRCHECGRNVTSVGAIQPASHCPHCSAPLHCCRTCLHFDSGAHWQCRAEIAEPVAAKSAANHCPQYGPRLVLDSTGRRSGQNGAASSGGNDPRSLFESLFKR